MNSWFYLLIVNSCGWLLNYRSIIELFGSWIFLFLFFMHIRLDFCHLSLQMSGLLLFFQNLSFLMHFLFILLMSGYLILIFLSWLYRNIICLLNWSWISMQYINFLTFFRDYFRSLLNCSRLTHLFLSHNWLLLLRCWLNIHLVLCRRLNWDGLNFFRSTILWINFFMMDLLSFNFLLSFTNRFNMELLYRC